VDFAGISFTVGEFSFVHSGNFGALPTLRDALTFNAPNYLDSAGEAVVTVGAGADRERRTVSNDWYVAIGAMIYFNLAQACHSVALAFLRSERDVPEARGRHCWFRWCGRDVAIREGVKPCGGACPSARDRAAGLMVFREVNSPPDTGGVAAASTKGRRSPP
jgi:hypothetical protein